MPITFAAYPSTALPLTGTAVLVQHGPKFEHPDLVRADELVAGRLGRAVSLMGFSGDLGQIASVTLPTGLQLDRLVLVGAEGAAGPADYQKLGARLAILREIVALDRLSLISPRYGLDVARGMALRSYRFDRYQNRRSATAPMEVTLCGAEENLGAALRDMMIEVEAVHFVRDLVNEPGNMLPPPEMARRIADAGRLAGLSVDVLDEYHLREMGFKLLLGVAQGSLQPARVVLMRLGDMDARPLALIGKGVTFDTGGINVKPVAGMWDMKGDMAGAAAIAGTMIALARTGYRSPLVAVLGLAENMTGGSALRPGDILRSLSGKTVEVRNTDCEGRLILADCLTYAQQKLRAHTLIDMATLTYAVKIGLGTRYAGLYGNCSRLTDGLCAAGKATGERAWPLPLDSDFHDELASDVADIVNWPGVTYGNGSLAAAFLEEFVEPGINWAHLDIAGPANSAKAAEFSPSGATGFGVALLTAFLRQQAEGQGGGQ